MAENEFDRQYRILDQTLSMHAALRDRYRSRALLISCALLVAAVILNACVFVDDATLGILGLHPGNAKVAIGLASVAVFFISLIELKVDWGGAAQNHSSAVEKLSILKSRFRQARESVQALDASTSQDLASEYARTFAELPPIPEADFNRLKRHHLVKKLLSEHISQNPGAPILLLRFQIWWRGIRKLAKG